MVAFLLSGCATEEQFYYTVEELRYSQDNKIWTDKYGEVPKPEKEYKEMPK